MRVSAGFLLDGGAGSGTDALDNLCFPLTMLEGDGTTQMFIFSVKNPRPVSEPTSTADFEGRSSCLEPSPTHVCAIRILG